MTLASIYHWRNTISLNNAKLSTKLNIRAECDTTTDLTEADLEAKLREESTWLGIG